MTNKIKNLIDSTLLSKEQILSIIDKANFFKNNDDIAFNELKGKFVALAFFENSTRTKISFDIAAKKLGASTLDFSPANSSISKGESIADTILTLEAMGVIAFVVRHYESGICSLLQSYSNNAIINAGDGSNDHPSQGLLDVYTLLKKFGNIEGLKLCIVGDIDNSRVARSNISILRKFGVDLYYCSPDNLYNPLNNFNLKRIESVNEAIANCQVLMFLRIQKERLSSEVVVDLDNYKQQYSLTNDILSKNQEIVIMHPGPVNYGLELEHDILKYHNCLIQNQVANGVYIRMAIFSEILG